MLNCLSYLLREKRSRKVNRDSEARLTEGGRQCRSLRWRQLRQAAGQLDRSTQRKPSYQSLSERCLARYLWRKGLSFKSQFQIHGYCVDFLVPPNLIVEAEGKVHSIRQEYDAARTECLESFGFRVFRIPNYMIFSDPSGVAEMIRLQTANQERAAQVNSRELKNSEANHR